MRTTSLVAKGELLRRYLPTVEENVVLAPFTSLQVGGVADYFITVSTTEELTLAVASAIYCDLPYWIIGGGTNVVISDTGFPGLVIRNQSSEIGILPQPGVVVAAGGLPMSRLLTAVASHGLSGLEPLCGLPGTLGGAVYGNAETFGVAISDFVREVTLLRVKKPRFTRSHPLEMIEIASLPRDRLSFGYRMSSLKQLSAESKPVILSVKLQLLHRRSEEILSKMQVFARKRSDLAQAKYEHSSGSYFRNPSGSSYDHSGQLIQQHRSAGWLLEQAQVKGQRIGRAQVSRQHANFLINTGGATAEEIRRLADLCRERVQQSSQVLLEEEVEYIGRW